MTPPSESKTKFGSPETSLFILDTLKVLASGFKKLTDSEVAEFGQELCGIFYNEVLYEPSQVKPGVDVSRSLFLVSDSHRVKLIIDRDKIFLKVGKGNPNYEVDNNLDGGYYTFTDNYSLTFETAITSRAKIENMVIDVYENLTGVNKTYALDTLPIVYQDDLKTALDMVNKAVCTLEGQE